MAAMPKGEMVDLNEKPHAIITFVHERQQQEWYDIALVLQRAYEGESRERVRHQNEKNKLSRKLYGYEKEN